VPQVNTGWIGGAYGVGNRMSIKATRACVNAILDGRHAQWPLGLGLGHGAPKVPS
jgi:ATP-dependent phosphoenolpyruvate carboxykinase